MSKKYFQSIGAFMGLLFLFGCATEPGTPPEEVVRMYQAYVDQNEFDKAGQLSTKAEQKRLKELELMIADDGDAAILTTSFDKINCQVVQDTAICDCELTDQYETYEAEFVLLRSKDSWLVDLPREEAVEYDAEIESMLDSLFEEIVDEN